ncbi:MAG: hypothetical protein KAX42_04835, partial [Sphaerotilus sp.]|nr:hypothetical protein [Sphaerotilus sp.]
MVWFQALAPLNPEKDARKCGICSLRHGLSDLSRRWRVFGWLLGGQGDLRGRHSGLELHCEQSLPYSTPSTPPVPADHPRVDPVLARVVPGRLDRLRAQPRVEGQANFFYREVVFNADAVRIMPGEFFVHGEDIVITTTLGSCIAACLWDRQAQIGGMNHFMLPGGSGSAPDAGRYGIEAMERLVNALVKQGATRKTLDAKVFGGAAMIQGPGSLHVGERNTRFVLDYLRDHGITLISKDVLGSTPRKV